MASTFPSLTGRVGVSLFLFLLSACGTEVKPEELALQAAKAYYEQLIHGDYEAYVEGTLHGDSIPQAMRQQLVLNMQMFMEKQRLEHRGIDSVSALRAVCDTVKLPNDSLVLTANAFLTVCYSDSTKEEIVVPMIEKKGIWYLH